VLAASGAEATLAPIGGLPRDQAALVCSAGLASAGALPDAILGAASAIAKVGISMPDPGVNAPKAEPGGATSGVGKSASARHRQG
jgi:hypothetical protein